MRITIDSSLSIPVYKQIHDQVVLSMKTGILKLGDKLPTIHSLAKKLGVSEGTIAKSYRLLELQGFIDKDRRRGAFVAHSP
jgi:GntR family transcriptional regulator